MLEEPSWKDLSVMLEKYRQDATNLLKSISQSLELALYSERDLWRYAVVTTTTTTTTEEAAAATSSSIRGPVPAPRTVPTVR